MRKTSGFVLLSVCTAFLGGCAWWWPFSYRDPAVASYISSIPHIPQDPVVPPTATGAPGPDEDFGIIGKRRQICNLTPMKESDVFLEVVALDPNVGTIWPGALFQGSSLRSGRLTPITLQRTPGTLTVLNLTKVGTGHELFSRDIQSPSLQSTQEVINALTTDTANIAKGQPADFAISISEVHTFEQATLDAGISAGWMSGSASASLQTAASKKHNALLVKFVQRYYSIQFNNPTSPDSFFDPSVKLDQIQSVSYPEGGGKANNPPMYISEVKYGRLILISISSDEDYSKLEAAVRATISYGLSGGTGTLDTMSQSIMQSSEYDGLVIGGSAQAGAQLLSSIIGGNIDGLAHFINAGATYDPATSPGAPISYTARYMDGSVAGASFNADFSLTRCHDEDVPITEGRIAFQVGSDDKDYEMYPFVTIRNGANIVADANGLINWDGAGHNVWEDHTVHGPFGFGITGLTMANCANLSATIGQRSNTGTNPGWRTTAEIDLKVNGNWFTARGISTNQDEFTWGDNHSDQDSFQLSCP